MFFMDFERTLSLDSKTWCTLDNNLDLVNSQGTWDSFCPSCLGKKYLVVKIVDKEKHQLK
jgi:hypothetical protein